VLLGDAEPGGRLPCTFPVRLEDTPSFLDDEPGVIRYAEGTVTGHRWYDARGIEPAFPFGFGLGYTSWSVGNPMASAPLGPGARGVVRVPVTNTGDRHGHQVVQLYVRSPSSRVRELRAFHKLELDPGETMEVPFELGMRDLARWDRRADHWVADAGEYLVWAGTSSRDLTEPDTLVLTERWTSPASGPVSP
jgi:beta-glucosidase